MRLLLVSATGYSLGLAPHLEKEGHSVEICVGNDVTKTLASGSYNVAVFDAPTHVDALEYAKRRGVKSVGVTSWSRLLSNDDTYKQSLIKAIGYTPADVTTAGTEVTVVCWFNGHIFISEFIAFNYTKTMAGDLGTTVPSSGYITHFPKRPSRLLKEVLKPLERFLRKADHKGCFSIDCVVNSTGIYVKDVSASITRPYTHAIYENTPMSKGDVLLSILDETSKPIKKLESWVCGVMVSAYPYPVQAPSTPVEVMGMSHINVKHSWLMDVHRSSDTWRCGQLSGCLGYIIARGSTAFEAIRRVYRTLRNIRMDGIQYRNDIGKGIYDRIEALRKAGVL